LAARSCNDSFVRCPCGGTRLVRLASSDSSDSFESRYRSITALSALLTRLADVGTVVGNASEPVVSFGPGPSWAWPLFLRVRSWRYVMCRHARNEPSHPEDGSAQENNTVDTPTRPRAEAREPAVHSAVPELASSSPAPIAELRSRPPSRCRDSSVGSRTA
jgi:hypothetical protein